MEHLDKIAEGIRQSFDAKTAARDKALAQARTLTRHCAHAIRAVHRQEHEKANQELTAAHELAESFHTQMTKFPEFYQKHIEGAPIFGRSASADSKNIKGAWVKEFL